MDPSNKIILEYVEKLRGTSDRKRQKLNNSTIALRPSDFPGILTQRLCDILIRFAYNGSFIDDVFRDHILDLVVDKSFTWNQVLQSVITTKADRLYTKCQLCELIREMIHFVQIKSFDDNSHADPLVLMMKPTLFFLTKLILDLLADEDELDTMQIEYEDSCRPYQKPLDALSALIHDDLCSILLSMNDPSTVTEQLRFCLDAFSKLHTPDKSATSLMEMLLEKHLESCKPTKYEYIPEGLALFKLKNPSIRILIPIFACFKPHESSKCMAETIQTFSEIMRVSGDNVVFDLLHASILLKCEESMELLHLPKQHRVDFRWQSTTFFYKKLPQIIGHLIEGGKVTTDDVRTGLERALNNLSMMFDAADFSWQNASFLTLLNELEPFVGIEATNPLRQRRKEHMKRTANLASLAETDNKLIENTEIDKLLTAVKEVLNLQFGQHEEFWKLFIDKINNGDCDDFDAVTSILTAEGKLIETGKAYALKNVKAQEPSELVSVEERIRTFDETFLLLSRIIINNPNLSISLFVNGGPGKTDAERAIFHKWSMWFVKRVARSTRLESKSESDLPTQRREVEMLVRLANAEVGIEDDEEEEEVEEVEEEPVKQEVPELEIMKPVEEVMPETEETVKEEREHAEEEKNEEKQEEARVEESAEVEKMDTSEGPAEPSEPPEPYQSFEPPVDQKEELEVAATVAKEPSMPKDIVVQLETPKQKKVKELQPVSWYEVHCPLPRITKRMARMYLLQLKEGQPFWRVDNPNLNFGSIVAAIPRICQLLVEEHVEKRHRLDRKVVEEQMTNILHAIRTMPCLFVCLVQWLDCEPDSAPRTALAITMKNSLEKLIARLTAEQCQTSFKWKFIQNTVQQMIDEIIDKSPAFPEVTCTAFSTARRFCPFVARNEKPDQVKLKHAWYYMRQQAWASPHALRLLEHANIAGDYNTWSHIYLNKTIKSGCGDIMKSSVDMIFSFLMMDDLNSIIRMHESLMDFWLSEDAESQIDGRFDPLSMRAVIRLMSQVMLIAEWTLDRIINEGPPLPNPLPLQEPIESPEPEDPLRREKWVFLLKSMLDRTVNRFFKILRRGLLCTVVNTIIQLIKSIAGAADCHAKRLLVRRIPPTLIFQLAYIEPTSVDYPLMNVFCDPNNEEHTRTKVMFLCALRRAKVL